MWFGNHSEPQAIYFRIILIENKEVIKQKTEKRSYSSVG